MAPGIGWIANSNVLFYAKEFNCIVDNYLNYAKYQLSFCWRICTWNRVTCENPAGLEGGKV